MAYNRLRVALEHYFEALAEERRLTLEAVTQYRMTLKAYEKAAKRCEALAAKLVDKYPPGDESLNDPLDVLAELDLAPHDAEWLHEALVSSETLTLPDDDSVSDFLEKMQETE